jgi:hypothetical protein
VSLNDLLGTKGKPMQNKVSTGLLALLLTGGTVALLAAGQL